MRIFNSKLMKNRRLPVYIVHDGNILNYLDSATTEKESSQYSQIDFPRIVNTYIELVGTFAYTAVIQSPDEFKKNYSSLMISLLNYVDTCLIDKDNHVWLTQPELPSTILSLICNLTDKIALIHMFVDFGYAEKIIQWVRRTDIFAHRIEQIGTLIFIIIHNLSRCKMGLEKLQEEKVFDILMEQRQLVNGRNNSRLSLKFGAALISVATNDELPEENKKLIVDTSRTLYGYCKEAASKDDESKSNELKSEGYHLSELLELLHRAFWNTYIIESILKNETNETPTPMQFFSRLFLSFYGVLLDQEPDDLEKIAAEYLLKILLQISSYPAYQGELVKNKQLCVVIESLAEREELKLYYTQFIWCNLKPQTSPKEPKEERSRMLYVSYDRANEEFCKKFVKDLGDKITIPIWVDYEREKLCDDIQKYSSLQLKTIKSATVIMILVSKAYGDKSTGKCAELCHIISTNRSPDAKKHIIVVNAEANYNFNRSWMINLLRDKTVIHYDDNIGNMTDKVREQIEFSKKLPKKRSFFLSKIARRTTSVSNSSSLRVSSHTQKESSDVAAVSDTVLDDDSTVLIATTRHGSDPVASCLIKQTGTDGSNWV